MPRGIEYADSVRSRRICILRRRGELIGDVSTGLLADTWVRGTILLRVEGLALLVK